MNFLSLKTQNEFLVLSMAALIGVVYIMVIIAPIIAMHIYLYGQYRQDSEKKKLYKNYFIYFQFEYGLSKLNLIFVLAQIIWFAIFMSILG